MIGIFGGTFNPIHIGHLRIALEAFEKYKLKQVSFIPCKIPVHKKNPEILTQHRLNMIKLAIQSEKRFVLDTQEITRDSASYMIETLKTYRGHKIGLIIGSDVLPSFTKWHRWKEILELAELLIFPRVLPISSTEIRKLLKSNKNPRYLLPEKVIDYIHKHRLYY